MFYRIGRFALLLFAVSLATFALLSASPIDPVQANVGQVAYLSMSDAKRLQLETYWGANLPLWERYGSWLSSALHGDFGMSLRYNMPVIEVIASRALNTLMLMFCSWLASGILGFALGVVAGLKHKSLIDRVIKGYCFVLASVPTFWLGLIFLMIFAVQLGWFPLGFSVPIGVTSANATVADGLYHLILPVCTLTIVGVANVALHTREKTIEIFKSDYVRFARARGEKTGRIFWRHGLRNVALPALTLQFASISEIFGGSVLVEQVFSYPGLGQAAVVAGLGQDTALLAGIAVFSAVVVFAGNLVADLLYGIIDPRIKQGRIKQASTLFPSYRLTSFLGKKNSCIRGEEHA